MNIEQFFPNIRNKKRQWHRSFLDLSFFSSARWIITDSKLAVNNLNALNAPIAGSISVI
jgi:hypothetical protein